MAISGRRPTLFDQGGEVPLTAGSSSDVLAAMADHADYLATRNDIASGEVWPDDDNR